MFIRDGASAWLVLCCGFFFLSSVEKSRFSFFPSFFLFHAVMPGKDGEVDGAGVSAKILFMMMIYRHGIITASYDVPAYDITIGQPSLSSATKLIRLPWREKHGSPPPPFINGLVMEARREDHASHIYLYIKIACYEYKPNPLSLSLCPL